MAERNHNQEPLITVYILNHNYGRFVKQAIESVLTQTLQDFELIIIDDGSSDGSQEVIRSYEGRERVYLVFQENRGLTASINIALRLARGKYFMRLDADDYLDPHTLEVLSAKLERQPELALVFSDYYLIDQSGNILEQVRRHDMSQVTLLDHPAHGACTLFRRSALLGVGGYDESFSCQDGVQIWLKLTLQHPIGNINLPLFYYRQHDVNLTRDERRLLENRAGIFRKQAEAVGRPAPRVVGIIPVRGSKIDSRSMPLRTLRGKTLIDWTVDAALKCDKLSAVIVTTPDQLVLEHIAKKYGDRVLLQERDINLARINTRLDETNLDALQLYRSQTGREADAVINLFVESPFRTALYISSAIDTMQIYGVDVVDGVRPIEELLYLNSGHGLKPFPSNLDLKLERDNIYQRAGGLHLIKRDKIGSQTHWMTDCKIGHVLLDQRAAFTIRSETDWQIAEQLAAQE